MSSRAKTNRVVKDDPGLPSTGDILENRYEVLRVIGEGGMGVVVEATDRRLDRPVALKLMHSHLARNRDFARRFEQEVLIAKKLNHTNTVRLYDFGTTPSNVMYLVMEYLEGRELQALMYNGPMTIGHVVNIGTQLLDGLAEAHAIDVVHRDLKPGNIFICQDRRGREVVKILDFGIAKSLGEAQQAITNTGQVIGTAAYLAPELFLADKCTLAVDVYAVGLMMLEMLLGRKVVDAATIGQMMNLHLHMPIILPPSLEDTGIADILHRAVAKDVERRFQSADEMLAELQKITITEPDMVLTAREIDTAFGQMKRRFEDNHARLIANSPLSGGMPEGTMVLDERDMEILYSEENATREYLSPGKTSPRALPTEVPTVLLQPRNALILGSIAAALIFIMIVAFLTRGEEDATDTSVENPEENSVATSVYEFIPAISEEPPPVKPHPVAARDEVLEETVELEEQEEEIEAIIEPAEAIEEPEVIAEPEAPRPRQRPAPRRVSNRPPPRPVPEPEPEPEPEEEEPDERVIDNILDRVLEE